MRESKFVNIDDAKNQIELTVCGKTFTIKRITIGARNLYNEYQTSAAKNKEAIDKLKAEMADMTLDEFRARNEEITKDAEEMAEEMLCQLYGVLQRILEKNGYEFSRAWWEDNADLDDIGLFIYNAIKKDDKQESSKKKPVF
jgi:hypothetical protein